MMTTRKTRILLVDDDRHLLLTLSDYLTFEGFDVVQADSGEAALRQIATHPPDLIVLDLGMPGMGGLGFLRHTANEQGSARFPVIVLTARSNMEGFLDSTMVDAFLSKPCAGVELVNEIRATLTRREVGARAAANKRGRVLLVENHKPTAELLSQTLTAAGYAVEVLQGGLEIFRAVAREMPDVIVIKEMLPNMKGSAVALMAKGHRGAEMIPFVLYDGSNLLQSRVEEGMPAPRVAGAVVLSDNPLAVLEAVEGVLAQPAPPAAPQR
jgi:DNA-binding response OmpR family regulator